MTGIVVVFRNVRRSAPRDFRSARYELGVGVVLLAVGAWVFQRWQHLFAEIV